MKKIIIAYLLFFIFVNNSFAQKISYKLCNQVSEVINNDLPRKVNKYNSLISTYCSGVSTTPTLHYMYNTKFETALPGEKNKMINAFCTNKDTQQLLEYLKAVELHYFSPTGKEIEVIKINSNMCY